MLPGLLLFEYIYPKVCFFIKTDLSYFYAYLYIGAIIFCPRRLSAQAQVDSLFNPEEITEQTLISALIGAPGKLPGLLLL